MRRSDASKRRPVRRSGRWHFRGRVARRGGTRRLDVPEPTLAAVVPIDVPIDPQLAERGSALYHRYCGACHGPAAVGGGTIPDLRRSAPETLEALAPILLEGVFSARGMPNFGDWLTDADISALRAYLLEQRARLVADAER